MQTPNATDRVLSHIAGHREVSKAMHNSLCTWVTTQPRGLSRTCLLYTKCSGGGARQS